jgi:hypothetical protein
MVEGHGGIKLFISWQPGSTERYRGSDPGQHMTPKYSSDLLPPTRHCFPIMPSNYESIKME